MGKRVKTINPVSKALVAAAMAKLGVTTGRDFAHALGFTTADQERLANRWKSGENAPSFRTTMELLVIADWLKPAALKAYKQAVEEAGLTPQVEADAAAAGRRAANLQERRRQTGGKR